MAFTLSVAAVTVALMISSIIVKPYVNIRRVKIGLYCAVAVAGAAVLLATGSVSVSEVAQGFTADTAVNPLKILALFLSMTLISVYLGDAGFFTLAAEKVFARSKGGAFKTFIALYFAVSVLTVFTSNDIIVLTFTPPVCIFAKKARVSPLPFLIGEFVAANTWSMALLIGNPTNVYLAGSAGISFFGYLKVMLLPAAAAGLSGLAALIILFRKQLFPAAGGKPAPLNPTGLTALNGTPKETPRADERVFEKTNETAPSNETIRPRGETIRPGDETILRGDETLRRGDGERKARISKVPLAASLVTLVACIIILSVSSFIGAEMWLVCVVSAAALTVFLFVYGLFAEKTAARVFHGLKKAPYELIPFVLSMFVIVLALKKTGVTDALSGALVKGAKSDGFLFGTLAAFCSNLLNNIPMSVLFEKIIGGKSVYATFGAVIGSNIGAFITPVGALAGIMWTKI
ncbi:MAG: SLC13 family permease, partial [Candidatus Borkfalkiaceae bacterium]|nr:SLC13 family permease [Christensenellaceae bacterium]